MSVHEVFDDELGEDGFELIGTVSSYNPAAGSSFFHDFSSFLANAFEPRASKEDARNYCDNRDMEERETCVQVVLDALVQAVGGHHGRSGRGHVAVDQGGREHRVLSTRCRVGAGYPMAETGAPTTTWSRSCPTPKSRAHTAATRSGIGSAGGAPRCAMAMPAMTIAAPTNAFHPSRSSSATQPKTAPNIVIR